MYHHAVVREDGVQEVREDKSLRDLVNERRFRRIHHAVVKGDKET